MRATPPKLTGHLQIDTAMGSFLGERRIRLMEAIERHGSILQAAKAVPMSYKAARDAVDDMNNLAPQPLVRRVLARNPSPFTYTGTQTYLVGDGPDIAVIDPGPDEPEHLDAILAAVGDAAITAICCTHTHRDHSPAARTLARRTGAPIVGCAPLVLEDSGPRADAAFGSDGDMSIADRTLLAASRSAVRYVVMSSSRRSVGRRPTSRPSTPATSPVASCSSACRPPT